MNKKEQLKFKKILMEKRDDLLEVVKSKKENDMTDAEIGDEIDSASQAVEKEMLFELTDNEKVMLDSIESALRRIEKGSFGRCESCGKDIPQARLKAIPWVRYDISCQSKSEKPR
jgi:DnaK suppressor protein